MKKDIITETSEALAHDAVSTAGKYMDGIVNDFLSALFERTESSIDDRQSRRARPAAEFLFQKYSKTSGQALLCLGQDGQLTAGHSGDGKIHRGVVLAEPCGQKDMRDPSVADELEGLVMGDKLDRRIPMYCGQKSDTCPDLCPELLEICQKNQQCQAHLSQEQTQENNLKL